MTSYGSGPSPESIQAARTEILRLLEPYGGEKMAEGQEINVELTNLVVGLRGIDRADVYQLNHSLQPRELNGLKAQIGRITGVFSVSAL